MTRIVMLSMLIVSFILGGCSQKAAQTVENQPKNDFPKKSIEIIVPYGPGGNTDITARILAGVVNKYMPNGQSVVVINKPGGSATIGTTEVFNAKPDGYKILITAMAPLTNQPHFGTTPYSHDSFQPIMRIQSLPQILAVKADAPWKTFEEWLDYVKKNPTKFSYSTGGGVGGAGQLVMEALNLAAGIQTKNVPFESGASAITAVLGGHVKGTSSALNELKAQIDDGALRPLINVGDSKSESIKDLPTLKERGINVGIDVFSGILAPKGLPKDVLDILHGAFKKALEDPQAIEQFKKLGVEPAYAGPEDFQKVITDGFNMSGEILKKAGLVK